MTVQFINSSYATGFPTFESMTTETPYQKICQRYYEIEYQNYVYSLSNNNTSCSNNNSQVSSSNNNNKASGANIAVVDFCNDSDSDIDLDGDGIGDMAHGNVVANLIKANTNANVFTFDITKSSSGTTNQKLINNLQTILNDIKSGKRSYDALNMSLSSRITYEDLSKALGVKITKDNVSKYQSQIKNWLINEGAKNGYATTAQAVQLLEQIAATGTSIYIAAANVNDGTDDELNLYTIAANTTSVGALDKSGYKASFSFNNSLIDAWALGEIEVKKVKNSSGKLLGYDLNNDGIVDISGKYTSGGINSSNPFLKGTSFASPYKLSQSIA